jgi:glycosyltransferase involved in cell wall biosynthesis
MPKNILQIIPQIDTGGAEALVLETARAIIANKDKCFILSSGGRLAQEFLVIGAKLIVKDINTKNPLKILYSNVELIKSIIKNQNIDLVHVHSRAPAISAYYACRALKIPLITTHHGIYSARDFLKKYYNSFMVRGDIVIANSQFTYSHILDSYNISANKIRLIYCPVDIEEFTNNIEQKSAVIKLLTEWKIDAEECQIILLPARLTSWKGQKLFIEVARILKSKNIKAKFIIAGDEQGRKEYKNQLLKLIDDYNLNDYCYLVGHVENMPLAFLASNIVVSPSARPEAFGMSNAQAQASGKIVIASNLGATPEIIIDGKTGFLFENNNIDDFAAKLEFCLSLDTQTKAHLEANAKNNAHSKFNKEQLHEKTLKIYDEVLKGLK